MSQKYNVQIAFPNVLSREVPLKFVRIKYGGKKEKQLIDWSSLCIFQNHIIYEKSQSDYRSNNYLNKKQHIENH